MKIPFMSIRDFCLKVHQEKDAEGAMFWSVNSFEHKECPDVKGRIRAFVVS